MAGEGVTPFLGRAGAHQRSGWVFSSIENANGSGSRVEILGWWVWDHSQDTLEGWGTSSDTGGSATQEWSGGGHFLVTGLLHEYMGHDVSNMRGFDSYRLLTLSLAALMTRVGSAVPARADSGAVPRASPPQPQVSHSITAAGTPSMARSAASLLQPHSKRGVEPVRSGRFAALTGCQGGYNSASEADARVGRPRP
ncbi:hypothetical protein EMIHUDRAFT_209513 [Emiliania huxleyi CCMP1516]|uniref:Uncharacterized protein n=2 Tax=Emiliania huxleyi TaxID=2903 RepID=A0A0D3J5U4_EMIH1|nr:hypothetical protein EMIHUDRAFT_209513 [Emiliania huxleyi CCMP1516]EOD18879.1 hypothetical protein EMIHUDRAFT_209513 [Emiliania huxleyi CCMP1516]|eukprot:XP_005771308.1 hypothetical protein EMIHUDRAFT_209513 [Emiliania huxleyi CCMP1516]